MLIMRGRASKEVRPLFLLGEALIYVRFRDYSPFPTTAVLSLCQSA